MSDVTGTPESPGASKNQQIWTLKAQIPPGWIELAAHDSDASMLTAFDEMLEPHRHDLSPDDIAATQAQLVLSRRLCLAAGMRIGGAVLTAWEERATAWMYGIWVVPVESEAGLNPVGLIERVLGHALAGGPSGLSRLFTDGRLEDFDLLGGRVGTSLYATVDASSLAPPAGVDPATLPSQAGVVLAAVPMPGFPQVAALVVGAAPTLEERGAMAVFASVMAHSVRLLLNDDDAAVDLVDITLAEAFGASQ